MNPAVPHPPVPAVGTAIAPAYKEKSVEYPPSQGPWRDATAAETAPSDLHKVSDPQRVNICVTNPDGEDAAFSDLEPTNEPEQPKMRPKIHSKAVFRGFSRLVTLFNVVLYFVFCKYPLDSPLMDPDQSWLPRFVWMVSYGCLAWYVLEFILTVAEDPNFASSYALLGDAVILASSFLCLTFGVLGPQALFGYRFAELLCHLPVLGLTIRDALDILYTSLPMVRYTLKFFLFFLVTFAIMGKEFFATSLSRQCVLPETGATPINVRFCKNATSTSWLGAPHFCAEPYVCRQMEQPNFGITNFDNFLGASMTIMQVITFYNCSSYMTMLTQAENVVGVGFFFCCLIVTIPYVVLNLFIAVITAVHQDKADEQDQQEKEAMEVEANPWAPDISAAEYAQVVAGEDHLVLVMVWARGCRTCKQMEKLVTQLAEGNPTLLKAYRLEACEQNTGKGLPPGYPTRDPTFHLYWKGQRVDSISGLQPMGLKAMVDKRLNYIRLVSTPTTDLLDWDKVRGVDPEPPTPGSPPLTTDRGGGA